MNKILISTTEDRKKYGSKARYDIIDILKKDGFKEITINTNHESSMKNLLIDLIKSYKVLKRKIKNIKDSIVVIQYPWNSISLKYAKLLKKYSKLNNLKTVVIIHDLNSFRTQSLFGKFYFKHVIKEYKFLNIFDYVICHNYKMKELLINNKVTNPEIIELKVFDYLIKDNNKIHLDDYKFINIAGNLSKEKAGYVYNLNQLNIKNYNINLYGKYDGEESKNIKYNGSFTPEELIKKLNKGFGLVWDGENLNECSGKYGYYLKLNNPHKFSLYMACNIPVIVWSKSALSKYVKENNIGVIVNSLKEIDVIMKKITKKDYYNMVENVKKINKKVTNGRFIKDALLSIK